MNSKLLAWSAALTLVLAVGCGPSQAPETQEPQQVQEAAACKARSGRTREPPLQPVRARVKPYSSPSSVSA